VRRGSDLSRVYRGVHLKDLILLHTALPDWVDDVYVNFRKMVQLSMIFNELMHLQNATLPIEPNMDLVNTVRVRLSVCLSVCCTFSRFLAHPL